MPDQKVASEYRKIYNDTDYFIDAITSDYAFYSDFINAVRLGGSEFTINRKKISRFVDEEWVSAIEDSLIALDNVIRLPAKQIIEKEEVLPIELSRNINSKSLSHLAQHTDYINSVEGDVITPSKILNVYREETVITYENKFVNTLIQRLYVFVNRRYMQMKEASNSSVSMEFCSDFTLGNTDGKINFSLEVAEKSSGQSADINERVEKLNSVITAYINSDFARDMGKNYVNPPIMRTNAITKNKDLKQCLVLWEFIQAYDKIGYKINVEENAEKPDEKYINQLYSLLSLQYMVFNFNVMHNFDDSMTVLESNTSPGAIEPRFKTNIVDIDADDYNVYDSEYRRVVPVSSLSNRRLSAGEVRIREAVNAALAAQKAIDKLNKAKAKKTVGARVDNES